MDIEKVLKELDELPGGTEAYKTEAFLYENIETANRKGDKGAALTLINELIGYFRYMGKFDDADKVIADARSMCKEMGITSSQSYATTLLNIATLERAMGSFAESLADYMHVKDIYDKHLDPNDYLYAALYNNLSLLYQETARDEEAASCLIKALDVISLYDDRRIEQAITRTNLAQAYLRLDKLKEAGDELISAEDIFEKEGGDEFHYPGCLNAIADLKVRSGDFEGAVSYYEKALALLERHVGKENPGYLTVSDNLSRVRQMLTESVTGSRPGSDEDLQGMDLARQFYNEYGQAMIHEKFAGYEDRITAGLVGRGSQCYRFDDKLSRDHDYGPDFCLWLDDDLYDEIGEDLQKAYDELPGEYRGYKRVDEIPRDGKRVGVIRTYEFYSRILDISEDFLKEFMAGDKDVRYQFFATVLEENLSQCTNGEVFKEGAGDFARIREELAYYPDDIWRKKIAQELHYSAQMGQYNYIRMLKRGEKVASEIALAGYMEHTMKLVYLINRKYAPYYKWLHRGMKDLEKAAVIMDIFNAVYDMPKGDERIRMTTEIVAAIIIEELNELGMAGGVPAEEKYLDVYSSVISI